MYIESWDTQIKNVLINYTDLKWLFFLPLNTSESSYATVQFPQYYSKYLSLSTSKIQKWFGKERNDFLTT